MVKATVPPDWGRETLAPKPVPEVVETSKSAGAVTMSAADKLMPDTVKVCCAEALPEQDENANRVPVSVMAGVRPLRKLHPAGMVNPGIVLLSLIQLAWLFRAALSMAMSPDTLRSAQLPKRALSYSDAVSSWVPIQIALTPVVRPGGKALPLVVPPPPGCVPPPLGSQPAAVVETGSAISVVYTFMWMPLINTGEPDVPW